MHIYNLIGELCPAVITPCNKDKARAHVGEGSKFPVTEPPHGVQTEQIHFIFEIILVSHLCLTSHIGKVPMLTSFIMYGSTLYVWMPTHTF